MRTLLPIAALLATACGGRIAADADAGATSDASVDATYGDVDVDALNGGRGPEPIPVCTGVMQCLENAQGSPIAGVIVKCDPVHIMGPWNLLLEKSINGQWQTVDAQAVQAPGFGASFQDAMVRSAQLTYRVCVVDDLGTRCADPFTTDPPPMCACEPFTCDYAFVCNTTIYDGCRSYIHCGACSNGTACNPNTRSCCPPGFMSDYRQGCVCAPPKPCPGKLYWDTVSCSCEVFTP